MVFRILFYGLILFVHSSCKRDPFIPLHNSLHKDGWVLTFHDEFDNPDVDKDKWSDPAHFGPYHGTAEGQCYSLENIKIRNGIAHLIIQEEPGTCWFWGPDGQEHYPTGYTSGILSSISTHEQLYGYFEIRCKIPSGKGLWPAFWLASNYSWPPEIDIFEFQGSKPGKIYVSHSKEEGDQGVRRHYYFTDLSKDFHVYAAEWNEKEVIYYLDNMKLFRSTRKIPDKPMYVIANLAVGGGIDGCGFGECPDENTIFPASMEVDYIRVYKKKD